MNYGGFQAVLLLLLMILTGLANPINTVIITKLVNTGVESFQAKAISKEFIIVGIIFLVVLIYYSVYSFFYDILKISISRKLRNRLMPRIIYKIKRLEYHNFEDKDIKDLISRVGSSPDVHFANIYWQSLFLPSALISLIGYLVIFVRVSPFLLVFIVLVSGLAIVVEVGQSNKRYAHQVENTQQVRKANYLSQLLTSKETLQENRTFQSSDYLNEEWHKIQSNLTKSKMKLNIKLAKNNIRVIILSLFITLGSLSFFIYLLTKNRLDYGEFIAYTTSIIVLIDLVTWEIPYGLSQLNSYAMYWCDYEAFMNLSEEYDEGKIELNDFTQITFCDVYFKYPGGTDYVINGLNCTIKKNESITIVGENAAGKSTMIKLLLRLYRPSKGHIFIDNYNLNDLSKQSIINLFSPVFQELYNFKLTLRENIALGNISEINNDEKILSVIDKMGLNQVYQNLPNGLNTYLGKVYHDGVDLSGGEWQKVALARALFSKSSLVILDEPTSALDPKSEAQIYEDFKRLIYDKTAIFISHRLGIARLSEKIFVIDNGKIIEEGSHQDLMVKRGKYYQMFTAQAEWYR